MINNMRVRCEQLVCVCDRAENFFYLFVRYLSKDISSSIRFDKLLLSPHVTQLDAGMLS